MIRPNKIYTMNKPNTNFTTLALELHEALGAWCDVECGRTSFPIFSLFSFSLYQIWIPRN